MPGYIICQRLCQLKNQLISSSHSSQGYKNRILDGFWNVEYALFLKEENWNWLSSLLKEKKKSNILGLWCFSLGICPRVCDFGISTYVCTHAYLHTLMQKWFMAELVQIFSSSKQVTISSLPWSDGWFEQLGRARARKALIYLQLNWFRQMQEDDTSLN